MCFVYNNNFNRRAFRYGQTIQLANLALNSRELQTKTLLIYVNIIAQLII